jgi:hypothetical protein
MEMPAAMRAAYDELIEAAQTARALAVTYYASDPEDDDDDDLCTQLCEWEEKVEAAFDAWLVALEDGPFFGLADARDVLLRAAMDLRAYDEDAHVKRRYGTAITAIESVLGI